jgi:pimeloyl-ACP methyl ester carboxylesterase
MLVTEDGVRLDAAHVPGAREGLCVVLAHGFTGSRHRPAARRIAQSLARRAGVVTFDFRGHGRSGGASTVGDKEIFDLAAAVDWARRLGYARVATVGFSMGASVVIRHAAVLGGVDAVVAVSGPARWYYKGTTAMRRVHWLLEWPAGRLVSRLLLGTRLARGGWDPVPVSPVEAVADIAPTPLLIVHGDADAYFPVEHAETLYAAAGEPRELWLERGFGHAENAAGADLIERIGAWLHANCHPAELG